MGGPRGAPCLGREARGSLGTSLSAHGALRIRAEGCLQAPAYRPVRSAARTAARGEWSRRRPSSPFTHGRLISIRVELASPPVQIPQRAGAAFHRGPPSCPASDPRSAPAAACSALDLGMTRVCVWGVMALGFFLGHEAHLSVHRQGRGCPCPWRHPPPLHLLDAAFWRLLNALLCVLARGCC